MSKWAPARSDGLYPYVVTRMNFGRRVYRIFYAANLTQAKAKFGWTRSLGVRRATLEDLILPAGEQ